MNQRKKQKIIKIQAILSTTLFHVIDLDVTKVKKFRWITQLNFMVFVHAIFVFLRLLRRTVCLCRSLEFIGNRHRTCRFRWNPLTLLLHLHLREAVAHRHLRRLAGQRFV